MTDIATTATRTWVKHASQLQGNTGPFYVNFGVSPQHVAMYSPSKTARTMAVSVTEDVNGEYIGIIRAGSTEPVAIRRLSIDPWDAISSERKDIFDFDGQSVRLKIRPYTTLG